MWKAPMPDYALRGHAVSPFVSYVLSSLIGVAVIVAAALALRRLLSGKDCDELASGMDAPSGKL